MRDDQPAPIVVPAIPWYQSKTIWVNLVTLAILAVGYVADNAGVLSVPASYVSWLVFANVVLNGVLRLTTVQPVTLSGPKRVILDQLDPESPKLTPR